MPHTRKKGPCTARGKPLTVRSQNESHTQYAAHVVKTESHVPYSYTSLNNQASPKNLSASSAAPVNGPLEETLYYSEAVVKNQSFHNNVSVQHSAETRNKTGSYNYNPVNLENKPRGNSIIQSGRNGLLSSANSTGNQSIESNGKATVPPMNFIAHMSFATETSPASVEPLMSNATSIKADSVKVEVISGEKNHRGKMTEEQTTEAVNLVVEEVSGTSNQGDYFYTEFQCSRCIKTLVK